MTGGEMFRLRPSMAGGWETVAKALGRKLRVLEDAGPAWCVALSVIDEGRNLYSQAFVEKDQPLYAEVVSDRYLEGLGGPLSGEQRALLAGTGWTDPAVPDGGRTWPNWYQYFIGGSRPEEAAHAMVFALGAVLGVWDGEEVCLYVFPAASSETTEEVVA